MSDERLTRIPRSNLICYQPSGDENNGYMDIFGFIYPMWDQARTARLSEKLAKLCPEMTWNEEIWVILLAGINEKHTEKSDR